MSGRRVFVTGLGVVSPCGNRVSDAFERVCAAKPSLTMVRKDPDSPYFDQIVGAADFDLTGVVSRGQSKLMSRAAQMAVLASNDAFADAAFEPRESDAQDVGVYLGCSIGGSETMQDHFGRYALGKRVRAAAIPLTMPSGPSAHVSMHFGLMGPSLAYSIACVSSTVAIGEAFRAIRDGYSDRIVVGGTEAQLNHATAAGWAAMRVVASEHPDGVEASCRPFDTARTGLVIGEGAAVLLLESEEAVSARGARPRAEVVGYGAASDAHNLTEPCERGQVKAMRAALADGGIEPNQVGYVNAHATGTVSGDVVESRAIGEVFDSHTPLLPVSSTKAVHGHLIGAAGALEALWTVKALETSRIPPTANLTHPDPHCPIDGVPLVERVADDLEYAMSNSFAFGGSNATLVFRKA